MSNSNSNGAGVAQAVPNSNNDVAIIGGGISGLHTAFSLLKQGRHCVVFEARDRLGGRIHSVDGFDLGPSWFWPGQSNIESLVSELGLTEQVFSQYSKGDALFEPMSAQQPVQRGVRGISMQGSYRIDGGLGVIIQTLYKNIVDMGGQVHLSSAVGSLALQSDGKVRLSLKNGAAHDFQRVVVAMPPRVAIETLTFSPSLNSERTGELKKVATWMAGHAKAVVVYDTPFWREQGLSGDVFSQRGPLSEMHDASLNHESNVGDSSYSLFGFFGTPPQHRASSKAEVDAQIVGQLTRIFGDAASKPKKILYKNWARDSFTATDSDQLIPNHHPMNNISHIVEPAWNDALIWSGTETAEGHYNGYIEGAVMASHRAAKLIMKA